MDCRSKTVGGGVSETDGVLFGLEFSDRADGAEDLLLHDLHIFADVGEDGWLDEVTLIPVTLASDFDFGALLLAFVDVAIEALINNFPDWDLRGWSLPHNTVVL